MFRARYSRVWSGLLLALVYSLSYAAPQSGGRAGKIIADLGGGMYYNIRPDFRRCIAPLCGGHWISAVNRKSTRCADGSRQKECYVADIKPQKMDAELSEKTTLVLGQVRNDEFPGFGSLGVLVAFDAWRPATGATPKGTWYGLRDNGTKCITYPCYSTEERVLNGKRKQKISGVDLNRVGANEKDRQAAEKALLTDELIAVGENEVMLNDGPAGDSLTLVASQFFLRTSFKPGTALSCKVASDCTLTVYHSLVNSPDDCYCTLCPTPLDANSARKNQESWQKHCSNFGFSLSDNIATMICPQVLCVAPGSVSCVDNQCEFLNEDSLLK